MLLTEEIRKKAKYIGDGAYYINEGYRILIFTTDGRHIQNKVYIDNYDIGTFLNLLKQDGHFS